MPQGEDHPATDREPAQHAPDAPLEERAVALDHSKIGERAASQAHDGQALDHFEAGVEHHGHVDAAQQAGPDEERQPHVAGHGGRAGAGDGEEHARDSEPRHAIRLRRCERPPPGQHRDHADNLEEEDLLLQQRHRRRERPDEIHEDERPDAVQQRPSPGGKTDARDPQRRHEHQHPARGLDDADPRWRKAARQAAQQDRRGHGTLKRGQDRRGGVERRYQPARFSPGP